MSCSIHSYKFGTKSTIDKALINPIYYWRVSIPSVPSSVSHEFYIQLALPISPLIIDGFWCSRCLNDRIKVPHMMRFAGGATTPLVVKIWTKQTWVKIEYSRNFDCNFALFKGKIWLWLFYNLFWVMVLKFYTKISSHFN